MEADWSVEMGHDDPVLEFPWASDDPAVRFYDLKNDPQLVIAVPEAIQHPPIRDCLRALNETTSPFQTAKCDVWQEHGSANNLFGVVSTACYIDVLFMDRRLQLAFKAHETLVRELAERVGSSAFESGEAEFVVHRCFYRRDFSSLSPLESADPEQGCYVTCYVRGCGDDEKAAYANWASALGIVREALLTSRIPAMFQ